MILSISQIQAYLKQAGWPNDLIPTAAAVFYFESGRGNTDAHNPGSPLGAEDSWGLAQVNRKAWPMYSAAQLRDPLFNLQVALMIYQKQGWRAWYNTYYKGYYKQFLDASLAAWNGGAAGGYSMIPGGGISLPVQGSIGVFLFGIGLILFIKVLRG